MGTKRLLALTACILGGFAYRLLNNPSNKLPRSQADIPESDRQQPSVQEVIPSPPARTPLASEHAATSTAANDAEAPSKWLRGEIVSESGLYPIGCLLQVLDPQDDSRLIVRSFPDGKFDLTLDPQFSDTVALTASSMMTRRMLTTGLLPVNQHVVLRVRDDEAAKANSIRGHIHLVDLEAEQIAGLALSSKAS